MNRCLWTLLAGAVALQSLTGFASAKNPFAAPSFWLDKKLGRCLSLDKSSALLPGSQECVQISGRGSAMNPIAGYFCEQQQTVGLFSNFGDTGNDIKPELYVGRYSGNAIAAQYCFRPSNDLPLEFNCKNEVIFESVDKCPGG